MPVPGIDLYPLFFTTDNRSTRGVALPLFASAPTPSPRPPLWERSSGGRFRRDGRAATSGSGEAFETGPAEDDRRCVRVASAAVTTRDDSVGRRSSVVVAPSRSARTRRVHGSLSPPARVGRSTCPVDPTAPRSLGSDVAIEDVLEPQDGSEREDGEQPTGHTRPFVDRHFSLWARLSALIAVAPAEATRRRTNGVSGVARGTSGSR